MATNKLELAPCASWRPDLKALLGRSLLDGEDASTFDALCESFRPSFAPRDVLEEFSVRSVVEEIWDTLRLRRLKAIFLRASSHEGLMKLMPLLETTIPIKVVVERWAKRKHDAIKLLGLLTEGVGLDQEAITAETLVLKLGPIERIKRMIMQAESRRNMMRREIDRHRHGVAQCLCSICCACVARVRCCSTTPEGARSRRAVRDFFAPGIGRAPSCAPSTPSIRPASRCGWGRDRRIRRAI